MKHKTIILKKVIQLSRSFGCEFRIGKKPKDCDIMTMNFELPKKVDACYFGEGVIFIKDETEYTNEEIQIIALHELGHAIIDLFPLKKKNLNPLEETMANAIAIAFAAQLQLPYTKKMVMLFNKINKQTIELIRGKNEKRCVYKKNRRSR